jgi:hypothetical protein
LIVFGAGLAVLVVLVHVGTSALRGGNELALVATLGGLAAACNIIVPIPNVELTTTVVACVAIALGARLASATSLVAVLGTGLVGGLGLWSAWQVASLAIVAVAVAPFGARLLAALLDSTHERWILATALAVLVPVCDAIVTAGSLSSVGAAPGTSIVVVLVAGLPFSLVHAAWVAAVTLVAGPSLLRALARARTRVEVPHRL